VRFAALAVVSLHVDSNVSSRLMKLLHQRAESNPTRKLPVAGMERLAIARIESGQGVSPGKHLDRVKPHSRAAKTTATIGARHIASPCLTQAHALNAACHALRVLFHLADGAACDADMRLAASRRGSRSKARRLTRSEVRLN
jgi:hypothetical protein